MKKLSILLLVALLSFSFVACGDDDESYIVSFTADGNSNLLVNNQDNTRLVLFKDDPKTSGSLLGGVPSQAQAFGVPLNGASGLFVLVVMTYDEYAKSGTSGKVAFSTLVFVDNIAATYTVAASLVGGGEFRLYNLTDKYVEIRTESWYGGVLTVLRPNDTKVMPLPADDYDLFPVLKKERKVGATVVGIYEKKLIGKENSFSLTEENTTRSWTINAADESVAEHQVAYVRVVNQSDKGGRLATGSETASTIINNSLGRQVVNPGQTLNAGIYYALAAGGTTAQSYSFVFIRTGGSVFATATQSLLNGHVYTMTIDIDGGAAVVTDDGTYETVYPETET